MGTRNERFTDAQIMRYQSLLQPIINFLVHEAEKQWKQNLKRNKKL